ncbi:hypothetical protein M1N90_00835 [Dehalococcoidia bacterium]|nr:hypothetical protein [Dehalococcoidia bacterium]
MRAKVSGILMILGPILTMGMWIAFFPDPGSGATVSEELSELMSNETSFHIAATIAAIAGAGMLLGIFLLSRTLNEGDSVGALCAEIGGLLIILMVPFMLILQGYLVSAVDEAAAGQIDVGEGILVAGMAIDSYLGFLFAGGYFLLGIALILQKRFHVVVGVVIAIASAVAFIDEVINDAPEIIPIVGWMGMFIMTVVIGVWTVVQKEN